MGRSNLTVVKEAGKNPTPWKEQEQVVGFAQGGLITATMARHPAGSGLSTQDSTAELLSRLQENRKETHRTRLRNMQGQAIAELKAEMAGMLRQHETETLLLDYRLSGHTLEDLGEIGDDEVVSEAWGMLSEEFEL